MKKHAPRIRAWRPGIGLIMLVVAGCSETGVTIDVHQPLENGPQRRFTLKSERAYVAPPQPGESARLLCKWPLPGSRHGRAQFALYLAFALKEGRQEIGEPLGDEQWVSGFFLQRSGRLAGLAPIVEGSIELTAVKPPQGSLTLTCLDGTVVTGSFRAPVRPRPVRLFEENRTVDIAESVRLLRVHRGEIEAADPADPTNP